MPRNISFMLTTRQFLDGTKDVTRRNGWLMLKAGDVLTAVEKAQGIPKGEHVKRLGSVRVKSVSREPLRRLADDPEYGADELRREGFPDMKPWEFIAFFCTSHAGLTPESEVTRIEFERI